MTTQIESYFKTTTTHQVVTFGEVHALAINSMRDECHGRAVAAGWYTDPATGERITRNVGEQIALMHSELSEMLEAVRKDLQDQHLPDMKGEHVEAADVLIRLLDYCGARGIDLGAAYVAKLKYNQTRDDHKLENRAKQNGKAF